MTDVYLIDKNPLEDLKEILSREIKKKFGPGEKIVVKTHLGEYGNLNYVRPPILGAIVEELKKIGTDVIVFDTLTWYDGSRHTEADYRETARKNGFTEETVGCPLVFNDDSVSVKGLKNYKTVNVAKEVHDADGMLVLSHVKGHEDASFGGAIKNLGMGAVDMESKKIAHVNSRPFLAGKCIVCGRCEEVCPYGLIKVTDKPEINLDGCYGCNACVINCPQQALKSIASVREFLAEATAVVLSTFDPKKLLYVSVLMDASKHCDCLKQQKSDFGVVLYPDIGLLVSDNIIAIDTCTLDLINKYSGSDNFFLELNRTDPYEQVDRAEDFGLGPREYTLIEV